MRKRYVFVFLMAVIVIVLLFWLGSMIYVQFLSQAYGKEFSDPQAVGFDCMHPWEGAPELRVLSYNAEKAVVYYFADTGGEKAHFVNCDGQWVYEKTSAAWSSLGGSADHYFIWPYFKNYVP